MKYLISFIFLAIAATFSVSDATAAVGINAPDRYEGIPEMCLMPMDFGYCRAKVKRFYFDMRRMKCATFYYGGCAGNVNNFKSLEECNKVCLDSFESNQHSVEVVHTTNNNNSRGQSRNSGNSNTNNNSTNTNTNANANANANVKSTKYGSSNNSNIQNRSDDDNDDYEEN